MYFFFNDTATTEIYTYCHTLSRHDALPISGSTPGSGRPPGRWSPPASPFRRSSPSSSSINGGMLHLMQISHKIVLTGAAMGASALAMPAAAQTLDVTLTLPRLSVAEYHRPYVAIWLEKEGATARPLSVLYDVDKRNNAGVKRSEEHTSELKSLMPI